MICNGLENQLKETFLVEEVKAIFSDQNPVQISLKNAEHVLVNLNKILGSTNRYYYTML